MSGANQIRSIGQGPVDNLFTPDTTQRYPLGTEVETWDPFFGYRKMVYGITQGAMGTGRLVYPDFGHVMTDIPNTANTGYPVLVAAQEFSAASQYGWFIKNGYCAVLTAASVAAGAAVGVGAAGKAGTNTAGKQLLNCYVAKASTYAPTKVCQVGAPAGSTIRRIDVPNIEGLFVGLAVSGTGVASAALASIDPSGLFVTAGGDNTAAGSNITITFTWTNYLLCYVNGAFVQGAIT